MSAEATSPRAPSVWIALHDLTRTGVPVVLVRLLRALPASQRARVRVVAIHPGPLASELAQLCDSLTVLEPAGRRSLSAAASTGLAVVGRPSAAAALRRGAWRARLRAGERPDVLVVHGAGGWPVAGALPEATPTVLHLHELSTGLDRSIPPADQAAALGSARRVLAVSTPVADLALSRGARPEQVELVPGVPDDVSGPHEPPPSGPAWVMGAGAPGWRKGTDRLTAVAYALQRSRPDARVGWVGGAPTGTEAHWVDATDPVHWIESRPDPWSVLAGSSVIAIPSREDPLPLVALEAGARARPVVAMPTGGLPALLADGRGLVGEVHDVGWFATAVQDLLASPDRAGEMGAALQAHVRAHHDPTIVAGEWWKLVVGAAS